MLLHLKSRKKPALQSLKCGNYHPNQDIHLSLGRDCFDAPHPLLPKRTGGKAGGLKVAVVDFSGPGSRGQLMVCRLIGDYPAGEFLNHKTAGGLNPTDCGQTKHRSAC